MALYPVTRRCSPTAAIGFVTSRVVAAVLILVGVVSLLTVMGGIGALPIAVWEFSLGAYLTV